MNPITEQESRIIHRAENNYWFPVIGLSLPFLKSSQPLTHGCPVVALVSGAAWLSRLLTTFFSQSHKNLTRQIEHQKETMCEEAQHEEWGASFQYSSLTGFWFTASGGCSWQVSHFHRSGFSCRNTREHGWKQNRTIKFLYSLTVKEP